MKNLLLTIPFLLSVYSFAQVGINTTNPQGAFHIDAKGDNDTNTSNTTDDLIHTTNGMLGVGTTAPTTKVHINNGTTNGAIRIVDGTQGLNKVLTSDANGVGTWKSTSVTSVTGTTPSSNTIFGASADKYMASSITLPQGKWFVYLGLLVRGATAANTRYAARFTFSNSSSTNTTSGFSFINNNRFILTQTVNGTAGAHEYGMFASGIVRVEVTSPSVTLYLWDENTRGFGEVPTSLTVGSNGENYLFAIRGN